MDIDFGYGGNTSSNTTSSDNTNETNEPITNLETGKEENLDEKEVLEENDKHLDDNNQDNHDETTNKENSDKEVSLQEGSVVEVDGKKYTVDANGNLLDEQKNIFKSAKEAENWIKSFDEVNDSDDDQISIETIKEAVGIDVTDEAGNAIEFENTPQGIKSYIESVSEINREAHHEEAINALYDRYPIVKDVLNYYIANGESLDGFGELPDRSNISISDTDESQQEAIIRTAWQEQNRNGDVDGYIAYLKSSGNLLSVAEKELEGLKESDRANKQAIEEEAERKNQEYIQTMQQYWNGVHDTIKSRKIAGYEIPESIIINKNGKRLSATPEDFFNYLYRVDNDNMSAYQHDLANETPESRRDDDILRAYLKFVGGNYSSLVNMAINKEKVTKLKLKSKEINNRSIRIIRPKANTNKVLDLGYN